MNYSRADVTAPMMARVNAHVATVSPGDLDTSKCGAALLVWVTAIQAHFESGIRDSGDPPARGGDSESSGPGTS